MYDFLEYLHRYCIKSIENWKAVPNLSCEIERGNIVESTEAMIGYHVIVKQKKVIIYDNDIASISNISGNYIAADLLVTRYLDAIGEFIGVSELDQQSHYEWLVFFEKTRRIFNGKNIVYKFLYYLFIHTYGQGNQDEKIKKYMKNIIVQTTFYGLDNAINVNLDESNAMLWYNFDTQNTNILFEKIDEDELLRILDEISDTNKYESLFNIVTDEQKEFLNSNITPILSKGLTEMNELPLDFYAYVNKYISKKVFGYNTYLLNKNDVVSFLINNSNELDKSNYFKMGERWTKTKYNKESKFKIHEYVIAITYVALLNHSYMKYINANKHFDSSSKINKTIKMDYMKFTEHFNNFSEFVEDLSWRIRQSFNYIGALENKKEYDEEYVEQLIQFVILSKFGYINVKSHFEYIENLNILNTELTALLGSDFAYVPNNMYNELFIKLFKVVNEWKENSVNSLFSNTNNSIPLEKLDVISHFIKQYDKPFGRNKQGKRVKAEVFEGINDFHKCVKEGFAANDVLLQLRLEMSVHENKRFNK
ncbi:hypothetical protein RJB71_11265 [Staphylococcus hominis]|uniref:hypothetical protein n=1 Tax=Staphylococcus hominis TaxID=1290 RepID=UPI00287AE0DD|nr:hypothetical protein [Staphylococcus hominis]MDS3883569.1 hypothetical protein [Staphylococcus hominis]